MHKNYINEYLQIINEFNTRNKKFINYGLYKNVRIYLNRNHIINRKSFRYDIIGNLNITYIKRAVMKFIKNNDISIILNNKIKQGIFFIIENKNAPIHKFVYLACEIQYNKITFEYEFAILTPLPIIDENEKQNIPYHSTTDKICSVIF